MKIIIVNGSAGELVGFTVPANSVILWTGVESSVPEGWSILAEAKGDSSIGNLVKSVPLGALSLSLAGSSTHSHTNPNTGTDGSHNHYTYGSGNTASDGTSLGFYPTSNANTAPANHTHSIGSGYTTSNGSHSHTVPNTDSVLNYPPTIRLNWITNALEEPLPVGAVLFYNSLTVPEGFVLSNGNNGTINLHQKFFAGANSDTVLGSIGGVESHKHITPNSTNEAGAHTHIAYGFLGNSGSSNNASGYQGTKVAAPHNHNAERETISDGAHTHPIADTGYATMLPPYADLPVMEYQEIQKDIPLGIIIAFKGTSIPSGWSICNGSNGTPNLENRFIRGITSGIVGAVGGSSTHTHTNSSVTSAGSHNHGGSTSGTVWNSVDVWVTVGCCATASNPSHSHNWGITIDYGGAHTHTLGNTGSASHEPLHIKLYFIQKT